MTTFKKFDGLSKTLDEYIHYISSYKKTLDEYIHCISSYKKT